ncbi:cold-shock protein [Streptomyces sp. NPDC058685]|uniref:cold-shock protein n=1 Tax=Streptomyces sp. NPDC058685 TaxID=3346598 RepID=UPI003668F988
MPLGKVLWFDTRRGVGAIKPYGLEREVSVESRAVQAECELRAGQKVLFDICLDSDGRRGDNVRILGS